MFDIEKIMGNKKYMSIIYIVLIAAVVLMTAISFIPPKQKQETTPSAAGGVDISQTERRLEKILSQISGVGEVAVMITLESGDEVVIANENKAANNSTLDKEGAVNKSASNESKPVLKNNGSGQNPIVLKEIYPKIRGVIVIARGCENAAVKEAVTQAVTAVLGIKSHNVYVTS